MNTKPWLTSVISVLIIFTVGCGFFSKLIQSKPPVLSTTPPVLSPPPHPTAAIQGTPEEQAFYFADQLASPETRLGAWLGIYDALGIPVIGQDGSGVGNTGDDPIGPRYWQIWYASGLDKKGRGIPLSDAGRLLVADSPQHDGAAFGPALLNDLRLALKSSDPQVRLMGEFIRERIKRWPSHLDIRDSATKPEEAIIDLPTLQLIAWVMMRGVLFNAASGSPKSVASVAAHGPIMGLAVPQSKVLAMFQASGPTSLPCSERLGDGDSTYWTNWLANKVIGGGVQLPGMKSALPGLIEQLQKVDMAAAKTIEKTSAMITRMNVIAVLLSFLLQVAAMQINPSETPDPLVRTKNTYRGKDGKIVLQLYSEPGKIPDGNALGACAGAFLANAFGISFSFPAEGPISGAEMNVQGGVGFPNLVLFNSEGTNSMRRWTDSNGVVEYKLFGAPQKRTVPDSAKPIPKEFSVHVTAQPEEVNGNTLLNIFFGGLTFGTAPTKAGGLGSALDIAKTFQYDMGEYFFNLTDWQQQGYRASGQAQNLKISGVICNMDNTFTLNTSSAYVQPFEFTPSSAEGGTVKFSYGGGLSGGGSGPYTIEGTDGQKTAIIFNMGVTTSYGGLSDQGTAKVHLALTPLEGNECDGK